MDLGLGSSPNGILPSGTLGTVKTGATLSLSPWGFPFEADGTKDKTDPISKKKEVYPG